ncbi:hypothetical protein FD733_15245 [Pantoea sp. Eser]|nr:hypothetical protein [Pantoea sp. Eser]
MGNAQICIGISLLTGKSSVCPANKTKKKAVLKLFIRTGTAQKGSLNATLKGAIVGFGDSSPKAAAIGFAAITGFG